MKKIVTYFSLVLLLLLSLTVLTACNSSDKAYVLPDNTEVESLSLYISETRQEYYLSGDELDTIIAELKAQPKLTEEPVKLYVGKESVDRSAIYRLTVTTKKKTFKKARNYTISVGVTTESTDWLGNESTSTDATEIRANGHYGTITGNLPSMLKTISDREATSYSKRLYDNMKAALEADGFTITDLEFLDNYSQSHTSLKSATEVEGFRASLDERSVYVKLCKTATIANNYTSSGGGTKARIYYVRYGDNDLRAYNIIMSATDA